MISKINTFVIISFFFQVAFVQAQNLDVEGQIKITDGTQGIGKVLTSDANGVASWQTPATSTNTETYAIGDAAFGGIVFWVDASGQHGLVCATSDQSAGMRWYAGTFGDTRAYGNRPLAGEVNTDVIIGSHTGIIGDDENIYAAKLCKELVLEGYTDWYLPSKEELDLMYQHKATIEASAIAHNGAAFSTTSYWSSTEHGAYSAWSQNFNVGEQESKVKGFTTSGVRAIRSF